MSPPERPPRSIFFVSDGTGITAETMGASLITRFEGLRTRQVRIPFVDDPQKAREAVRRINEAAVTDGARPIVFTTLVHPDVIRELSQVQALVLDLFATFVVPLEVELGMPPKQTIGGYHTMGDTDAYTSRIEAINFSLAHDDGQSARNLEQADVILLGVSRSGKTPTSLYLAMQHGIKAANYPLIPEDFERGRLPTPLAPYKRKCFGLTIDPDRLSQIRNERRPGSKYAAVENCRYEVREAEAMMRREGVSWLSSTHKSIEEIATTILRDLRPDRLIY
jgi:regulator of PEP synthase PpsR (kinase-PPPase family)